MYNEFEAMVMAGRSQIPGDHPESATRQIQQFSTQYQPQMNDFQGFSDVQSFNPFLEQQQYQSNFYNDISSISVPPPDEAGNFQNFSWDAVVASLEREDEDILSAWNSVSKIPVENINYSENNACQAPVTINNSQARIIPPTYDPVSGEQLSEAIVVEPSGKMYTAVSKKVLSEGGKNFSSLQNTIKQSQVSKNVENVNFTSHQGNEAIVIERLTEENKKLKQEIIELKAKLYELTEGGNQTKLVLTPADVLFSENKQNAENSLKYKKLGELLRRNRNK